MKNRCAFAITLFLIANVFSFAQVDRNSQIDRNSIQWAEKVMKAFAAAYPNRIEKTEFKDGDWTVLIDGKRFYYAGGRLLHEDQRNKAAEFSAHPLYVYQEELPQWKTPTEEEAERYKSMAANRRKNRLKRSTDFYDAIWRMSSSSESSKRVTKVKFLGYSMFVHDDIVPIIQRVEKKILLEAINDTAVHAWIKGVDTMECWNWRNVADAQGRSFHAYAIAVDILPKKLGGKETYWLWATRRRDDWWNVSYDDRYHPPAKVIKAFESEGFIWGGKWLYFDTMHFEYRPELFLLAGLNYNR